MNGSVDAADLRVLILAPSGADAPVAAEILAQAGMTAVVCENIPEMCEHFDGGAGALLLTEEALLGERPELLSAQLAAQEPWSDVPIVLLTSSGEDPYWTEVIGALFAASGNLTLIERPCRAATLASAVKVALRARGKQYEVRELLLREQAARREASAALEQARRSEAAREALLESERAARTEAESANRLKDEFLATLSHELRTPLSVIVSWSRVLLRKFGALDEQLRQGLSLIVDHALAQSQLISDLLDMSRIVSGKVSLDAQPTDLAVLVSQAVSSQTPAAEAKGIMIELHQPGMSAPVLVDPTRLQQVFWNLLANAIKFTPPGGRVTVTTKAEDGGYFEVCVRDTGEGISAEFLPHLFDRFRQADGSTSRRHGGLGLGLAIVKQIVEMHGGMIEAESDGPGRGACFMVRLPQHRGAALAHASPWRAPVEHDMLEPDALAGLRILAVEDEPDMLEFLRRMLEEHGAHVTAVRSGPEALACLRALEAGQYDALVSDIGMPGMDGYALVRAVREELGLGAERFPAIAVTAFTRPEDRARVLAAGFQSHLSKPYQVAQLVAIVRELTRPQRRARTGS